MLLAAPALAQTPQAADARTLALAAGWKASFLCSGTFVAGLSETIITETDLKGAYPELQAELARLPAKILRDKGVERVEVRFDEALPPRIARHTAGRGCVQLPVGATVGSMRLPPALDDRPNLKAADARPWPIGDARAEARLSGRARTAMQAATDKAFASDGYGAGLATSAVLVVHNGKIVAERYRPGFTRHTAQRSWSVAKSLTSALAGRTVQLGLVDVHRPATIGEWRADGDPRAGITLDQLLRMQSGLWTNGPGNRTDAVYFGGAALTETATVAPVEAAAGSRFRYSNTDSMLAAHAIVSMAGRGALDFPARELLWPLGMTRTTIETEWAGHFVLSSQVWMTARDMARLALLHLNDGMVGETRLLPEGWVAQATTASGPQPDAGRRRQMGYGRAIWLFGEGNGLPAGSYAFLGNRGQLAIIVPARNLVVVRRGFDPHGVAFDGPAFARDVIAALGE